MKTRHLTHFIKNWVILLLTLSVNVHGQKTLTIQTGKLTERTDTSTPVINISYEDDGIIVDYKFNTVDLSTPNDTDKSVKLSLSGFSQAEEYGMPSLPQKSDIFFIDKGYDVSLEIIDAKYEDYDIDVLASNSPLIEGLEMTDSGSTVELLPNSDFFPLQPIAINAPQIRRNAKLLNVGISPIQYVADSKTARIFYSLKYKIRYVEKDINNLNSLSIDEYRDLSNVAIPLKEYTSRLKAFGDITVTPSGYLIIAPSEFTEAAQRLAEWKRCIGINAVVETKTVWTQTDIQNTVNRYYENKKFLGRKPLGDSTLEYVVLFGTSDLVETFSDRLMHRPNQWEVIYYDYTTDVPYFCMDGEGDTLPDIYFGRLIAKTKDEADIIVNKVIKYERYGANFGQPFGKGLFLAGFWDNKDDISDGYEDTRFVETVEDIRQHLSNELSKTDYVYQYVGTASPTNWTVDERLNKYDNPGEALPEYMTSPNFDWNGNTQKVIDFWNQGYSFVLGRGHGINGIWGRPDFEGKDALKLSNGDKLPFVFAIYCQSCLFNNTDGVTHSLFVNPNGGSIGSIGASGNCFSGFNDIYTYALFRLLYPKANINPDTLDPEIIEKGQEPWRDYTYEINRAGQLLDLSKILLATYYNETKISPYDLKYPIYLRRVMHCLADPSLKIYTHAINHQNDITVTTSENGVLAQSACSKDGYLTFYNTYTKEIICVPSTMSHFYETPYPEYVVVSFKPIDSTTKVHIGNNANLNYIKQ